MGNSIQAVQQFFTDTWDAAVSLIEGEGDSKESVEKQDPEKKAVEDSFSKRPGFGELRRMESRQGKQEKAEKSMTGLCAPGDEHLNNKYAEVDTALNHMAEQSVEAIRETLGLKPGQKIPGPMTVRIGVSGSPGDPKALRVLSVKAKPGFRYRLNGDIPTYRTSADISVAARNSVPSAMFPAYVDLSKITHEPSQILLKIQPDGSYELVKPEGTEDGPVSCDPKPPSS